MCITCVRVKGATASQLVSDLPDFRINPSSPFTQVGLDYAGPVPIKLSKIRSSVKGKGYFCLFICMSTDAIHLELVTDMTTKTFLNVLRRFTSRRGNPNCIYSDNGTNFVGAENELQQLYKLLINKSLDNSISSFLSKEFIEWKLIPPFAPHCGGIWKSGVKSVKHHLRRNMGNTTLCYEELNTLLIQIEGILKRPLSPLYDSLDDFGTLTPSH